MSFDFDHIRILKELATVPITEYLLIKQVDCCLHCRKSTNAIIWIFLDIFRLQVPVSEAKASS